MTRTVLAGGHVLDVLSGVVERSDLAFEGDRIVSVATGLDGDVVVDCAGGLLVPGFIDCHTHVCLSRTLGSTQPYSLPRSAVPLSAVPVLATLLRLGVTTVRDAWGADAGIRLAVASGWIDGPEVLISLRQLCTTGGIGDQWAFGLGGFDSFADPAMPDPVSEGEVGARAAVRRMVRAGADWIKVTATGSIRFPDAHDVQLTVAEMAALVETAHRHGGRGVMVHAHAARAAELAAVAGARSIEHGVWLDEAAVHAMASADCWYVPTLSATHGGSARHDGDLAEAHRRSVRLAIDAGVPIAMGSDAPVQPHAEVLHELAYLAEAGLGAMGALRAATVNAARLLGLSTDRGVLAAGMRADIVLLNGTEPDVAALDQRVRAVWRGGTRVSRE
ncbi:imidazolonepropionase-like amidohydrolase [Tamaricihabitans halophyticus]|uniref:Imidazolonepropionase-like amidohydrolase n=1 Tax=Tamaricihabitans halophyticus TaxID=1262583 RepID=A0A4R2QMP3_9PSEU|nr:amidohydrolase family protein [Tamaricihabitans halophyticus]TCP50832.1 imidazolonepropionase-like amidohydrolase [Tamaricihabitans halophyticus]